MNPSGADKIDWSLLFFGSDEGLADKLMARARRRFGDSPDADSAYNFALDRLSADDWSALAVRYKGKGTPQGFLAITFINALEDYARAKYPRARPPEWLRRLGDLWLQVWRRLCLKREAVESIVDALSDRDAARAQEIRGAAKQIRARVPNCGQVVAEEPADLGDADATTHDTVAELDRDTLNMLTGTVAAVLDQDAPSPLPDEAVLALRDALDLPAADRLLLKLLYDEGMSVAAAARALDLTRKQASRRHLAILGRLREALGAVEPGQ